MNKVHHIGNAEKGDRMKESKKMLKSILNSTQMGQIGIRSVMNRRISPPLQKALESQLREYDALEREAVSIASSRGWELQDIDPVVKVMSAAMSKAKLSYGDTNSKIAAMMIEGNTRGMILGLRDQHNFTHQDSQIQTLSQKLIDCERANILQMQGFL